MSRDTTIAFENFYQQMGLHWFLRTILPIHRSRGHPIVISTWRTWLKLAFVGSITLPFAASAETVCTTSVDQVRFNTDGSIDFYFKASAPFRLPATSAGRETISSAALTALASQRVVIVSYGTDNAGCTASSAFRGDVTSLIVK